MADSRKIKTSNLWNCFEDSSDSANKVAICKICKSKLSYKSSTSNLKKHIERKHPTVQFVSTKSQSSDLNPQPPPSTSGSDANMQRSNAPTTSKSDSDKAINNPPTSIPARIDSSTHSQNVGHFDKTVALVNQTMTRFVKNKNHTNRKKKAR